MPNAIAVSLGIEARLSRRGAWFSDDGLDIDRVAKRIAASRAVAANFPTFERVRDAVVRMEDVVFSDPAALTLLDDLLACAVLVEEETLVSPSADTDRYLRGGWLEELIGLAAIEAGADEVRIGQKVGWISKGFEGENEIDTIARFGDRLVFVSAKALRSRLAEGDVRHRERLMEALQEADNLVDHFGEPNSAVALVVTTDLWDERSREPRYEQLHGKAAALGVKLVTLETVQFESLVDILRKLGEGR